MYLCEEFMGLILFQVNKKPKNIKLKKDMFPVS